jgi:hypothetical protein
MNIVPTNIIKIAVYDLFLKISNKLYTSLSYSKMCSPSVYWIGARKYETQTQKHSKHYRGWNVSIVK